MVTSPHNIARLVLGAVAGIVGYLPVLAVLVLTRRGRLKPGVGVGAAAVGVSFAMLTAFEGAVLAWAPQDFYTISTGGVVGYLTMLVLLAVYALRRG